MRGKYAGPGEWSHKVMKPLSEFWRRSSFVRSPGGDPAEARFNDLRFAAIDDVATG